MNHRSPTYHSLQSVLTGIKSIKPTREQTVIKKELKSSYREINIRASFQTTPYNWFPDYVKYNNTCT